MEHLAEDFNSVEGEVKVNVGGENELGSLWGEMGKGII